MDGVVPALGSVFQDLRFGLRTLLRQPIFTAAATLTLALVIGAAGSVFSLLNAVLLRAWPFPHPEQLVLVAARDSQATTMPLSMGDFGDYRAARSFSVLAAAQGESVNLTGIDEPARLAGAFVSSEYFPLFGVKPLLGRLFVSSDDRPAAARVCLLSESLWRGRFGADPRLIGRTLVLNGELFTVAGIVPSRFLQPIAITGVWLPIHHLSDYSPGRSFPLALGMGRLASGVSLAQARAEMDAIAHRLAAAYPDTDGNKTVEVLPMRDRLVAGLRPTLLLLGGAVVCVLLIACANIAGLLLAKASARHREMAIRAALGAGAARLFRQLLTESLLLAVFGGTLGAVLSYSCAHLLPAALGELPGPSSVIASPWMIPFLAGVSIAAGLLFGLAPALLARRAAGSLRLHGASSGSARLRGILVTGQVALALVLLSAAGLTVKSLARLMEVDPGFRGDRVLTMEYRLPANKYSTGAQQSTFHDEVVRRVSALPGVEAAGIVRALPFSGNSETVSIGLPDRPAPPPGMPFLIGYNAVTPTYFETAGMKLLGGRGFEPGDGPASARVIVVSRSFATRFWPGGDAIGRQALIPSSDVAGAGSKLISAMVVGVVGDVKQESLNEPASPQMYVPYAQDPFRFATLAVRVHGDPLALAKSVQRAIWSIDRDQPMWKIRTLQSLVDASARGGDRGLFTASLVCFSAFALLLAAIGLYGVLAYTAAQRSPEFGIRMALGARPQDILALVLRSGLVLAGAGLAIGLAVSLPLNRLLASQLYEVRTGDPGVYAGICALLLLVSLAATAAPARRAMRIDPSAALRHD